MNIEIGGPEGAKYACSLTRRRARKQATHDTVYCIQGHISTSVVLRSFRYILSNKINTLHF